MIPYYDSGGILIYHGDWRDVPLPPSERTLLLTDPPYGIHADARQHARAGKQHGSAVAPSRDYGAVTGWDSRPADTADLLCLVGRSAYSIIWGGNYFGLPGTSCWLVWDKQTGNNGYADAELAWSNLPGAVRIFRHRWMGMLRDSSDDGDHRVHPTQKPVPLMRWCADKVDCEIVYDPYMGSGSSLVAARDLGRRAIGVEIEERYCEIAARRLDQFVLDFNLLEGSN